MTTNNLLEKRLASANQSHLMQYWNELTNDEKNDYQKQLNSINFEKCNRLFGSALSSMEEACEKLDNHMKPIPNTHYQSVENSTHEQLQKYTNTGLKEISQGHVGVLLLAGGQGTRLGVTYPKGMYSVDLPSRKTLFQIQAERIKKIQETAEHNFRTSTSVITWYIMTSGPTDHETANFLKRHHYFGLEVSNIVQFKQGLLPCFDMKGGLILEAKNSVSLAPDGNGGIYRALQEEGILEDMQRRGIRYLHAHSVDNILVKVADPVFIGYCITKNADCGAKVVKKASPSEAVGVVCQVHNRFQVVEYSEITETTATATDVHGNLLFHAGNICNHFFTTKFLKLISERYEHKLKLHVAKKKIPFVNEFGKIEKPEKVNGIKIEKFIFDVFQFTEQFVAWEVPRHCEFSALKNSDELGKDCPKTARKDLYRLHKYYIEEAGGTVVGDVVEISPLVSYAGEGLDEIVKNKVFYSPVLITSKNI